MYAGNTYTKNVTVPDLSGVIIVGYNNNGVYSGYIENFVNDQFILLSTASLPYTYLRSVTYNSDTNAINKFSAVGGRTDIPKGSGAFSWYSLNGTNWSPYSLDVQDVSWMSDVTYGSGVFISVGQDSYTGTAGVAMRSTDGMDYVRKGNSSNYLYGVTYGGNKFIAVGAKNTIIFSIDTGMTWSNTGVSIKNNNGLDLNSIAYCNNTYVAVGNQGNAMRSSDGLTWTAIKNRVDTLNLSGVACFNNIWVAVGTDSIYGGTIVTSVDGANSWNRAYRPTTNPLNRVTYNNGNFVVVGNQGTILTALPLSSSTLPWTWTAVPNPQTTIDWKGITSIQ